MSIKASECYERFGAPEKETDMILWDVPSSLEIGVLPNKIYCNKLMVQPLTAAFTNIITRNLLVEVKTWDGCFNIRQSRGGLNQSLHSWGMAVDINAAWNGFGKVPTMSEELVACFTDAGFEWGGVWPKQDGMHFQLESF